MSYINNMSIKFSARSENEAFARVAVASFCSVVIKNIEILSDIKTAVSEAVTNAIVHGYNSDERGEIELECKLCEDEVVIRISDFGVGIENINEAKKPFFTTKPDMERSGMGFTVMEGFMDKMEVETELNKGTVVTLTKKIDKIA